MPSASRYSALDLDTGYSKLRSFLRANHGRFERHVCFVRVLMDINAYFCIDNYFANHASVCMIYLILIKKNVQHQFFFYNFASKSLNADNGKMQPDEGKLTEKAASYSAAIYVHI